MGGTFPCTIYLNSPKPKCQGINSGQGIADLVKSSIQTIGTLALIPPPILTLISDLYDEVIVGLFDLILGGWNEPVYD